MSDDTVKYGRGKRWAEFQDSKCLLVLDIFGRLNNQATGMAAGCGGEATKFVSPEIIITRARILMT